MSHSGHSNSLPVTTHRLVTVEVKMEPQLGRPCVLNVQQCLINFLLTLSCCMIAFCMMSQVSPSNQIDTVLFVVCLFETGSHYVVLAILELTL